MFPFGSHHYIITDLPRVRVEGILDVTLSDHAKMADGLDGHGAQHVVLCVGESLRGSYDNGLSRVDTQGVHVLHIAHLGGRGK